MSETENTLYYVHDPMCSWCWGFARALDELEEKISQQAPGKITITRLLGGLAPDSDEPMPAEMRQYLEQTWQNIQQRIPGTRFNFNYWRECEPRRSTYPACRAVIAARQQGQQYDRAMTRGIQQAYYLEASNPSDQDTLIQVAGRIGLQAEQFQRDLEDPQTHQLLLQEINQARQLGVQGFPSLVLVNGMRGMGIAVDPLSADAMMSHIEVALEKLAQVDQPERDSQAG